MYQEIINNCTVEGNNIKLPAIKLERDVYMQVADKLKKIGGKWNGGKTQAFVFPYDPSELLGKIQSGENVNIKKDFQFFETPTELARRLVKLSHLNRNYRVLEPSAGQGSIIKQIVYGNPVDYYEIQPENQEILSRMRNVNFCGSDFLQADESIKYERIIANPPFSKNQDIDHIRKMYAVLAEGGRLVSVASTHWQTSKGKKEEAFILWLVSLSAVVYEVEAETFKESGTNIKTAIIVIKK